MSCVRLVTAVSFFFLVSGCGTTDTMSIPKVASSDVAGVDAPIERQATFALSKVVVSIRRGTPIAHFPTGGVAGTDGYLCNHKHGGDSTIEWASRSRYFGDWRSELGEIFHETLTQKGLNIAGDPKSLFKRDNPASSAEYLIGARITKIKGNFCESHHWWDGRPLGEFSGEMYLSVEWTVFSNLMQREVLKFKTEGYNKQKKSSKNGIDITFQNAFASATESILRSEDFKKVSIGKYSPNRRSANYSELLIPRKTLLKDPISESIDKIIPSVVTLRVGTGHGSGFVIAEHGLILTNQHVVGDAKKVGVILSNGLELEGQVLRRSVRRDVALVKVPLRVPNALALRPDPARRLDKVYSIGTPMHVGLKSTVTTGIVSAHRKYGRNKLKFIQSDVAVSSGNSGGPLLDDKGNVIGISVLKLRPQESEALNLFIPIEDALKALNIRIGGPES
jgi:serine protease Do